MNTLQNPVGILERDTLLIYIYWWGKFYRKCKMPETVQLYAHMHCNSGILQMPSHIRTEYHKSKSWKKYYKNIYICLFIFIYLFIFLLMQSRPFQNHNRRQKKKIAFLVKNISSLIVHMCAMTMRDRLQLHVWTVKLTIFLLWIIFEH